MTVVHIDVLIQIFDKRAGKGDKAPSKILWSDGIHEM
jgi:hypothetical protein